jgi:hypothetical protein
MPKVYFTEDGAAPTMGTQIGAKHCMPGAQSPGPWHGQEHLPAAVLHLWVRHCASAVQGTPCGFGFMPVVAGAAVVGGGATVGWGCGWAGYPGCGVG